MKIIGREVFKMGQKSKSKGKLAKVRALLFSSISIAPLKDPKFRPVFTCFGCSPNLDHVYIYPYNAFPAIYG